MKFSKLSDMSSYKLDPDSFRHGEHFVDDIEEENTFYDRLYTLSDEDDNILVMSYLDIDEEEGFVLIDLLTLRRDLLESGYDREYILEVLKHFQDYEIRVRPDKGKEEFWKIRGFIPLEDTDFWYYG